MNIQELTVEEADISLINYKLDRYGIAVVRNFISQADLAIVVQQFEGAFDDTKLGCTEVHKHPLNPGKVARYQFCAIDASLDAIKRVYSSEVIRAVERGYYGDGVNIESCDQIFFTHEVESESDILPWHFDRQESLKFYVNLDDVNEENGAFQYDPGSHRLGHMIANYCIAMGEEVGEIRNDVPDSFLINPVRISVNAGDLVIFDAAGFHKAGSIRSGKERRVMRAHSHPLPIVTYNARVLSSDWFISKILRGLRPLSVKRYRRLSSKIIEKLELTR